ncbi:MAG: ABC transporter permease [Muribaculaceae bacterium]|nr:ABC transporter permease [Muribaculaceae bacterium]
MRDLLDEIMQALRHNRLRTALTGLSVSWGIFMLIVLLGLAGATLRNFEENVSSDSSAKISVWAGQTSRPYKGNREGRRIHLRPADIATLKEQHKEFVSDVSSIIYCNYQELSGGSESVSAGPEGVSAGFIGRQRFTKLMAGRDINAHDIAASAKIMIIPESYAKTLFPDIDPAHAIGRRVSYAGLSFLIVGIHDGRWDRSVYIPFTTAMMLVENKDALGSMEVALKNVSTMEDGEAAEEGITRTLASVHDFDPDDSSALWISNSFTQAMQGRKAGSILQLAVWILGLLTLLTGIVGISNIMFVSVRERTHEIGIRRAIGARPRSILTQILAESVAITVLFGYIGIVLGTAFVQLLAFFLKESDGMSEPAVSLGMAFQVTAVLVVAGALAGLFPALRALKVKPVEALRDE